MNGLSISCSRTFESFGARVCVQTGQPYLLGDLAGHLPPRCSPTTRDPDVTFYLSVDEKADQPYVLWQDGVRLARAESGRTLLCLLESALHTVVARNARQGLFVHSGVVGWEGGAVVVPGMTHSGKSSLIAALVSAGATYFSDEFAVFDERGHVWPYPRALCLRAPGREEARRVRVESIGGRSAVSSAPVSRILVTKYFPEAQWRPEPISKGEAVLALLQNTVLARTRSRDALDIFARSVSGAEAVRSPRGEALSCAPIILNQLAAA